MQMSAIEIIIVITGIIGCLAAAISALSCMRKPLARNCGYVVNHKAKIMILGKLTEDLCQLMDNVERELRGSRVHRIDPERWKENAREIVEEVISLQTEKVDANCLSRFFSNYCSRLKVGKHIAENIELINELLKEGQNYIAVGESLARGNIRISRKLVGLHANAVLKDIWSYVMDDENARIIGIYGMAGTGKTTIVTQINNKVLEKIRHCNESKNICAPISGDNKIFDNVIWVDVPYQSDLRNLQMKIAKEIDLDLSGSNNAQENAAALVNALMKRKRYLLILDDMWRPFSLEEIGIPELTIQNGCKLVIISRSSSICCEMKTEKNLELKLLSMEEAWDLFVDEIGPNVINLPEEIHCIMKNVAKECGGLPLAIITVARALRKLNNNTNNSAIKIAWNKALTSLRESTANLQSMEEKVFARLRFSYERLQHVSHNSTQSCFLYCAMYPEDHHIDTKELMEYWMWEGLLGNVGWIEDSMQVAERILDELKDACLLETVGQDGGVELVKMHALIRDMAINITKTSPRFFIKAGLRLRKPLFVEDWPTNVERASLMRNDLKELPYAPNCRYLTSLLLQYNSFEGEFHDGFFRNMPYVRVLDLSYTGLLVLPESLSGLKYLHALYLRSCWNLLSLPNLSELEQLMVFDISDTRIRQLPEGMEKLSQLRRLDLTHTRDIIFPPGLVLELKRLQELLVDSCGFLWESKSSVLNNIACMEELTQLHYLVTIEVNFSNTLVFNEYINSMHWHQIKSFKFSVGGFYDGKSGKNSLAFMGSFLVKGNPVWVPRNTLELRIMDCGDISWLTIPSLKSLKVVEVCKCENLKYLFKQRMLRHLPNLEEIVVKDCLNTVEVIEQDVVNQNAAAINFPRLQKLMLLNLPNLKSFYNGVVVCNSLRTITILQCHKLKRFPIKLDVDVEQKLLSPHSLKQISAERAWLESLEWDRPNAELLIQCLFAEGFIDEDLRSYQHLNERFQIMAVVRGSSGLWALDLAKEFENELQEDVEMGTFKEITPMELMEPSSSDRKGKAIMIEDRDDKGTAKMDQASSSKHRPK